ncbi:hypothetical protein, partial [Pectobacterium atrosepticum]
VTDNQLPIADRRTRGARRITVIISAYQRVGCQITQHLHANWPAGADTDTAVRGLKLRSVLAVERAERDFKSEPRTTEVKEPQQQEKAA